MEPPAVSVGSIRSEPMRTRLGRSVLALNCTLLV
jgi:hypothetical protein